jgi:hypothetical protein
VDTLAPSLPAFAPIADTCRITGLGRSSLYEAMAAGHVRAVKNGKRTLVDIDHALHYVRNLPAFGKH